MMTTDRFSIQKQLLSHQDEEYRKFHCNLVPGKENIIGVRLPAMRKIAKELAASSAGTDYLDSTLESSDDYYEETMVQGLIIGYLKTGPEIRLDYVKRFIPKIDNWAICDSFCANLKFTKKNTELVWDFVLPYLKSDKEYHVRFATVMLMDFYVDEEHITRLFHLFNAVDHEGYYVKMAVAWALSVCFIKFPEETLMFFKNNNLDNWTYNKALQKTTESRRVDDETKQMLKEMKRK